MDNGRDFSGVMTEAVLWLKILSGLIALVALPALMWALSVTRQLDEIIKVLGKHDDTWVMSREHKDHFAGLFRAFRRIEASLAALMLELRRPRR